MVSTTCKAQVLRFQELKLKLLYNSVPYIHICTHTAMVEAAMQVANHLEQFSQVLCCSMIARLELASPS